MTTNDFWTGECIKAENDFADKFPSTVEEVSYKRFGFEQGVRWRHDKDREQIEKLEAESAKLKQAIGVMQEALDRIGPETHTTTARVLRFLAREALAKALEIIK